MDTALMSTYRIPHLPGKRKGFFQKLLPEKRREGRFLSNHEFIPRTLQNKVISCRMNSLRSLRTHSAVERRESHGDVRDPYSFCRGKRGLALRLQMAGQETVTQQQPDGSVSRT